MTQYTHYFFGEGLQTPVQSNISEVSPQATPLDPMTAQREGALQPAATSLFLYCDPVPQYLLVAWEGLHPLPDLSPRSDFAYEI